MDSPKKQARLAGLLYLLVLVIAPLGEFYFPSKYFVSGDAAATASRILASEGIFRLGTVTSLAGTILFFVTVLVLYRLLKPVSPLLALIMLGLVMVAIPLALLGSATDFFALSLFKGTGALSVFEKERLHALGYTLLRYPPGLVTTLFWGLWLYPFGLLVWRSGFIPRIFGVFLMIAGTAYFVGALTSMLAPQYTGAVNKVAFPMYFGEVPIIFWLLIKGVREPRHAGFSPTSAST